MQQTILVIFFNIYGLLFFALLFKKFKISFLLLFPLYMGIIGTIVYIFSIFSLFKESLFFLTFFFFAIDIYFFLFTNVKLFDDFLSIIKKKIKSFSKSKIKIMDILFWFLILFFYVLVFWESFLLPETTTDSLYYHLPTAKFIAVENGIPLYRDQLINEYELPLQSYMFSSIIHTFYAIFFFGDIPKLIYLLSPLASINLLFLFRSLGKKIYGKNKYFGFSLLLIPIFFSISSTSYLDIFVSLMISSSLFLLYKFLKCNKIQYFYISSLLLGIGSSIKIIHLIIFIPFIYIIISNKKINRYNGVISYLLFISFVSIVPLKNLLIFGNPIYPYFREFLVPLFSIQINIFFFFTSMFLIVPFLLFLLKSKLNINHKIKEIFYIYTCIILILLPILTHFRIITHSNIDTISSIYNQIISSLYSGFFEMSPGSPHISFGLIIPIMFLLFIFYRQFKKIKFKEEEKILILFSLVIFLALFLLNNKGQHSFIRYSFPFFILGTLMTDNFICIIYNKLKRIKFSSIKISINLFKHDYKLSQILYLSLITINLLIPMTFWVVGIKGINHPLLYKYQNPLASDSEDYEHWRNYEMQCINYINKNPKFEFYLILGYEIFLIDDNVNYILPILDLLDKNLPSEIQDSLDYLRVKGIAYIVILNSDFLNNLNTYNSLVNFLINNNKTIFRVEDTRGSTGLFSAILEL